MGCGCQDKKDTCASCVNGTRNTPGWVICNRFPLPAEPIMVRGGYNRYADGTLWVKEESKCTQYQAKE